MVGIYCDDAGRIWTFDESSYRRSCKKSQNCIRYILEFLFTYYIESMLFRLDQLPLLSIDDFSSNLDRKSSCNIWVWKLGRLRMGNHKLSNLEA